MDLVASRIFVAESCDRNLKKKTFKIKQKLLIHFHIYTPKRGISHKQKPLNVIEIKRQRDQWLGVARLT